MSSIAVDILKKHAVEAAKELVLSFAIPALEAAAKKSATPVDDMVLAALKPALEAELLKLIEKV